jgi:hypothetical protein
MPPRPPTPARDRGRDPRTADAQLDTISLPPPRSFAPSVFGNRLAGEHPVRQSSRPEPTAHPWPGPGRTLDAPTWVHCARPPHLARIQARLQTLYIHAHTLLPRPTKPPTTNTARRLPQAPSTHSAMPWCHRVFPTGPAMWPLLRTTTQPFPLIFPTPLLMTSINLGRPQLVPHDQQLSRSLHIPSSTLPCYARRPSSLWKGPRRLI